MKLILISLIFLTYCTILSLVESTIIEQIKNKTDDSYITEYISITNNCEKPDCQIFRRSYLYPHKNPQKYYKCKRIGLIKWEAQERDCDLDKKFNFLRQKCVRNGWVNVCKEQPTSTTEQQSTTESISTTKEITTEVITTEETTTEEITTKEITTEEITTEEITTEEITTRETTTEETSTTENPTTIEETTTEEITTTDYPTTIEETTTELSSSTFEPIPTPGPYNCSLVPQCDPSNLNTRFPMRNVTRYYECELIISESGAIWKPVQKTCLPSLYFSFSHQACVDPSKWVDVCLPDFNICEVPKCFIKNKLYPDFNPRDYYECVEDINGNLYPQKQTCVRALLFGYEQQRCIPPNEWQDPCIYNKANAGKITSYIFSMILIIITLNFSLMG
uniref:CSON004802 protein n=1 Tax=Culicoides sonorensis TaxID=179676 RepID=A0A336LX38_CULSO